MSLQSKEKNIDAHLVKVIEFAARRKLLLQIKLVKLLGPALGARAGGAEARRRPGPPGLSPARPRAAPGHLDRRQGRQDRRSLRRQLRQPGLHVQGAWLRVGGELRRFFRSGRHWKHPAKVRASAAALSLAQRLSQELRDELPVWRVVLEGAATLQELETTWSLDDLYRANAALDFRAEAEAAAIRAAQARGGKGG